MSEHAVVAARGRAKEARAEQGRSDLPARVRAAVDRGAEALLALQESDGRWQSPVEMGPTCLAITALTEAWLGVLTAEDAALYTKALKATQLADGGFAIRPFAERGTLGATAVCRAALKVCGVADGAQVVRRAEARLAALGGTTALRERLYSHGEPGLLFAVMAGLAPAELLPPLSPEMAALPWSERMLEGRVHGGVPVVVFACAAVRDRFQHHSGLANWVRSPARLLARTRLSSFLGSFQNPNGSWNGMVFSTVFNLIALSGLGLSHADPMVARALRWIESRKARTPHTMTVSAFDGENWETAFALAALVDCGVGREDPRLQRGQRFLRGRQCTQPQAALNQPNRAAPRTGGWGFMAGNDLMADCDDSAVVLAGLGSTQRGGSSDSAIRDGIAWMRGMQNESGGFASYVHGFPDKPPGEPMFVKPLPRLDDVLGLLRSARTPPPEMGDPATSDLAARALWGFGECGLTTKDPMVARAIAFLERDQRIDGSWWGMWNPAYLATTAFVLLGLASVGHNMKAPVVKRAVAWLLSVQNPDGGFGEAAEAFEKPELAGKGPSNPPLTGLALRALAECAHARALHGDGLAAAERAARYLVDAQTADGSWPNGDYLFTIVPPTFYSWGHHRLYYVLLGLGRYAELHVGQSRER